MKASHTINFLLRLLMDYLVLMLAFLCTYQYIFGWGEVFFSVPNLLLLAISIIAWPIIGMSVHLYEEFRTRSFSYEFIAILKTTLLHTCFFTFLFFYFFEYYPYPRTFTLIYALLIFTGITVIKFFIKQSLLRLRSNGYNIKNILIVGTGDTGMKFYNTIRSNDHFGYRCIGFLDEHTNPSINGQYLGKIADLPKILEDYEIDDIIVALPETQSMEMEKIIITSEKEAKRVRIIADCHRFCTSTASMNLFGTFPLLTIRTSPLDDLTEQRFKRIFELCFTTILFLTIFWWLFPLIALLIKLTSPGPILFKQNRQGLNNKQISCYKFRSMTYNSDTVNANGQYIQTTKNDSRVTPIGRFLRKTNLDELPQFFNVLMGDMALVGPRPHPIPLHQESRNTIQNYMLRHVVKPGITGWAQVNGYRGETTISGQMQKRVDFDLWYIEHYSFWLDCQIIFQTLMNMIKGDKNAY